MAYGQGEIITAADYNSISADVNEVFGDSNSGSTSENNANFGYGQAETATPVSIGNVVTATQWTNLFNSIHDCATHQGTASGIVPSSVSIGQVIDAYDGASGLLQLVQDIRTNRLSIAGGQSAVTSGGTKLTSSRGTSWTNELIHEFTVDFSTYDEARYFFNTGGQIRFSGERTGGSATAQNTSWTDILSNMSNVLFNHTQTTATGDGTGSALGFYNLTDTYQQIYTITGSTYGSNRLTIDAKSNAAFGTTGVISFRVTFESEPGPDPVDGTISSFVDERRSTGAITISSPTYTTITELTAGS